MDKKSTYYENTLIEEMATAIQEAIEVQERFSEKLKELKNENKMLCDFIVANELELKYIQYRNGKKTQKDYKFTGLFNGLTEKEAQNKYVKLMSECRIGEKRADLEKAQMIDKEYKEAMDMLRRTYKNETQET